MSVNITTLEPGNNATIHKDIIDDSVKLTFGAPSVKFTPKAEAISVSSTSDPKVSINTSGTGLNRNMDFAFEIPKGTAAGFGDTIDVDYETLGSNDTGYFRAKFLNNDNAHRNLKFEVGLPRGAQGPSGDAGKGVTNFTLSAAGELTAHYSDGSSQTIGNIKGPKGNDGTNGTNGTNGTSSIVDNSTIFNIGNVTTSGSTPTVSLRSSTNSSTNVTTIYFDFNFPSTSIVVN